MDVRAVGISRTIILQKAVNPTVMNSDDIDQAVKRVREAIDDVVDDAEDLSDDLRREVTEAIDDLEKRLGSDRSDE